MSLAQYHEEQDAFFSRADRFDGFDRGDLGRDPLPVVTPRPATPADYSDDIEF